MESFGCPHASMVRTVCALGNVFLMRCRFEFFGILGEIMEQCLEIANKTIGLALTLALSSGRIRYFFAQLTYFSARVCV